MANLKYEKEITALLAIDLYNDFISEGDKIWDRLKGIAEAKMPRDWNSCHEAFFVVVGVDAPRRAPLSLRT
jgi:hypothetical protein